MISFEAEEKKWDLQIPNDDEVKFLMDDCQESAKKEEPSLVESEI